MKKTFLMMAGLLVLATACEQTPIEPDDPGQEPAKDEITITPESAEVENSGDKVEVLVTSSGEWTLSSSEKYDWVTPSAVEGKDGDKVFFQVNPNETQEERNATFTFSCGEADDVFTLLQKKADPVDYVLELDPATLSFEANGGSSPVMVTSLANDESASWTLTPAAEYEWITPSAEQGEDGDIVTFNVAPNLGKEDLTATFNFANEGRTAELTVTAKAKVWTLALTTEAVVEFDNQGGDFTVSVESNIPAENLYVSVPEEASWITSQASNQGDNTVDFFFNAAENATYENRSAVITISNGEGLSVTVTVNQKQTDRLEVSAKEIILGLEGGDFEIPVTTNIEYDVDLSDASGVTHVGTAQGPVEKFFAAAVESRTEYKIKFVPKNSDVAAVTVPVTLKTSALINYVANMRKHYAYPKTWNNAEALNNLNQFTVEMLINIQEWKTGNAISSLFGIENTFLIRMGDGSSKAHNMLQLAYNGGAFDFGEIASLSFAGLYQQWLQLVFTFDNGKVSYYFGGGKSNKSAMLVSSTTISAKSINFGVPYIQEGKENQYPYIGKYAFWIGRSYDNSRDFQGWMSEVRVWNKVLTTSEMNATNHKYYVDPNSEGLVAYWRFNEGDKDTNTVKDWSASGNDLTVNSTLEYIPVSLP